MPVDMPLVPESQLLVASTAAEAASGTLGDIFLMAALKNSMKTTPSQFSISPPPHRALLMIPPLRTPSPTLTPYQVSLEYFGTSRRMYSSAQHFLSPALTGTFPISPLPFRSRRGRNTSWPWRCGYQNERIRCLKRKSFMASYFTPRTSFLSAVHTSPLWRPSSLLHPIIHMYLAPLRVPHAPTSSGGTLVSPRSRPGL